MNAPVSVNVNEKTSPSLRNSLSQIPVGSLFEPEVEVCGLRSRLVQVTLVPTLTTRSGSVKSLMSAASSTAGAMRASTGAAAAGGCDGGVAVGGAETGVAVGAAVTGVACDAC